MKKIVRLAFETLFWLLTFISIAHADPITAAISAFSTFLGSGTIFAKIVSTVLLTAANIGIGLLNRAKQTKPGIKADIQVGGDNPLSFIVGTYATPGQLEYVNTYGKSGDTPNAFLSYVISLSDIPVSGFGSTVWVDGEKCTISDELDEGGRGYGVTEFKKGNKHSLWVKLYDGTQTEADQNLIDNFGADPDRPWTSNMIGVGVAYAIVTVRFNRKFFTGIPQFRFEIQGIKLYNPAKDSTNGGSGSHRWMQPETYEFSDNNAVINYNITRGIYYEDQWIYGGQNLPALLLPATSWIAAINECDVAIPLDEGGTEKQYRGGYEIVCDQEPLDTIELFLDGCSGRMNEIGGFYKIKVGAPTAAVYSFTDGDVVATEESRYDPFPGMEGTYNGAHASYPEPLEAWQTKDAPPYLNAALVLEDEGRELIASLTLATTPFNTQVQRLMKAAIEANRRFRRHVIVLPPEAWLLEPGDTISWSSTREGYIDKDFVIGAMTGKPGMLQTVSLQEVDASDYDWTPSTDQKPYTIGYLGSLQPAPQVIPDWAVAPATFYDSASNARRPSIAVTYSAVQDDVRAVRVMVRLASDQSIVYDSEIPYNEVDDLVFTRTITLNGTFLPNTLYQARGEFVPFSGRDVEWSSWLDVTTPNVLLGDQDVYLPGMVDDINNQIFPINVNIRDLIAQQRAIALKAMEQDAGNYQDKKYVLTVISAQYDTITAEYQSGILVATGPDSAIVQRLDTLEATIPDLATVVALDSLTVTVTNLGDDVEAMGEAVTGLEAQVDGISASALFRTTVEATEAGALSTIGLSVAATSGGATSAAAITLSALAGGLSRVGVLADQFFIRSEDEAELPFVFQDGVARLNIANIGTVNAGLLQSFDELMKLSLNEKYFSMRMGA